MLVLRRRGLGPVLIYWFVCSALAQTTWLDSLCFSLASLFLPMAPKVRAGERRAAERADREANDRRVRQRLDEFETSLDGAESLGRNHDQRISFQESPQRIVLRGFACVGEFMRARGGDFQLAKRAFIGAFFSRVKGAPGYVGNWAGYLLCSSALCLQAPRQMFQDRVRKVDGGKAKGKGKDKGKKGGKGKGKGKDPVAQPKRAAAPNAGDE